MELLLFSVRYFKEVSRISLGLLDPDAQIVATTAHLSLYLFVLDNTFDTARKKRKLYRRRTPLRIPSELLKFTNK